MNNIIFSVKLLQVSEQYCFEDGTLIMQAFVEVLHPKGFTRKRVRMHLWNQQTQEFIKHFKIGSNFSIEGHFSEVTDNANDDLDESKEGSELRVFKLYPSLPIVE